uniref:Fungal lipase-like domain-containing protein n=1 Tax=Panagrolaimus sp. JU765 TaxID=591449 RepID=A0AC34QDL7_9BILA
MKAAVVSLINTENVKYPKFTSDIPSFEVSIVKIMIKVLIFIVFSAGIISTIIGLTIHRPKNEFSDWEARHRWFPIAYSVKNNDPVNYLKDCFDKYEVHSRIEVPCDVWLESKNSTVNDTAMCTVIIVVAHDDYAIYIAFRGTSGDAQAMEENEAYHNLVTFIGGGKVNSYFYLAFKTLWNKGLGNAIQYLRTQYPTYEIRVTGHSLGGSLASLAAFWLSASGIIPPMQLRMISFGEPKVGDEIYSKTYSKYVPLSFRVVNHLDLVPHVPDYPNNITGYVQHLTEVWYYEGSSFNKPFIICNGNQNQNCSSSIPVPDLSLPDHDTYFANSTWCLKNHQRP